MADIAERLRAVLPEGVVLAEAGAAPVLWPGEAVPGAVPARLAEFSAGRDAARRALRALGFAGAAIPMDADRSPIWPDAVTGSISHCAGACLAVMAHSRAYLGLGLDVEPLKALPPDLWPTILRPEEMLQLAALPAAQHGLQVLRIFVAKEAAYKAQYAVSRRLFDFQMLRINWQDQGFNAEFCSDVSPFDAGFQIKGDAAEDADFTAAVCWLPIA
ncbi:hypothetical protein GCM10010873_03810 [Cypionkella aquatica]|uniref:Enterobactin synthase component D n=1 Tax=Cypionkella aquatica TaxID=1756042 RepID=A0AA37TQT1_9RHOB|nr:4'-phosphopantetheinyl transferase superfamily protein [Cypionkella aquatica]GLS85408.1 hypothetical protein GCM10010873_03810 [Cypionkella aquatica]